MAIYDIDGNIIPTGGDSGSNDKIYVVFGDSIPAFGAYTGGTGTIVNYLQSYVGGTWHNFAIGGSTMSAYRTADNAYDRFTLDEWADSVASDDFSEQRTGMNNGVTSAGSGGATVSSIITTAESLDWSNVDTVVLAFGTNDLGYDVVQVGTASDSAQKNGTMVGALKYAINTLLTAYPFMKIVVCGIPFRNADNPSVTEIISANAVIKEACENIGIKYVDMFGEMGINATNRTFFLYDGTHPSFAGKVRYATVLAKHLYKVTEDKAYSVKTVLTNATTGSYAKSLYPNQSARITVSANSGYTLSSVIVTMGGADVTSTVYSNGVINIAHVTGDIVITAIAL